MFRLLFGKASVSLKIFLLGFVPMAGLVFLSAKMITRDLTIAREVEKLEEFRSNFRDLLHALILERVDADFYMADPSKINTEFLAQQQTTNAALTLFWSYADHCDGSFLGKEFCDDLTEIEEQLGQLETHRTKALSRSAPEEVEAYYAGLVHEATILLATGAKAIKDAETAAMLARYGSWMKRMERAALIDALLGKSLAKQSFETGELSLLCMTVGEQSVYDQSIMKNAPQLLAEQIRQFSTHPSNRKLEETLKEVIASAETGPQAFSEWAATYDTSTWLSETKQRLALSIEVEQAMDLGIAKLGKKMSSKVWWESLALVAFVLLTLGMALWTRAYLTSAIKSCLNFNTQVAEGDLSSQLTYHHKDEMGSLMGTMNLMVGKLTTMIVSVSGDAEQVSSFAGNLATTSSSMRERLGRFFKDSQDVGRAVTKLNEEGDDGEVTLPHLLRHTNGVKSNIDEVEKATSQMSHELQTCSASSRKVAMQTTNLAGAMEEMSVSLDEIRKNTEHSSHTTGEVAARTSQGVTAVTELDSLTHAVEQVTRVVATLASQTHLLALNASIEAANAGDAGRGFAVVANEVKVLAGKSSEAADNIQKRIQAMRDKSQQTAAMIREVGGLIDNLESANQMVASAVTQQAAAMREISEGVEFLANHTREIDENLAKAAGNAERVAAQVEEAAPGVTRIRDGIAVLKEKAEAIQIVMERNGQAMAASESEVERTHDQAKTMSNVATRLLSSISIFRINRALAPSET